MRENKTQQTPASPVEFIMRLENEKRKDDSLEILKMMEEISGEKGRMWGESIVGFGNYHYKYASGKEGDWFVIGFSPRKQNITIYLNYFFERNEDLMEKLGKYKTGKACLYLKELKDVDKSILYALIERVYEAKKNEES